MLRFIEPPYQLSQFQKKKNTKTVYLFYKKKKKDSLFEKEHKNRLFLINQKHLITKSNKNN